MKTSLPKMLTIALLASGFAFQAYAGSTVDQRQRMESDSAYWNNHSQNVASNEQRRGMMDNSTSNSMPSGVSHYPCARCVYDSNAGGYVLSPTVKR
jgi:hypothetical protein